MMRKLSFLPVLVLLALSLSSASATIVAGQQGGPPPQERDAFTIRAATLNSALTRNDIFDCSTYLPDAKPILPAERQVFNVVRDDKITPDDGKDYLGAIWSPGGDTAVFVVPNGSRDIQSDEDTLPSDDETWLVGISKNELILYSPARNTWEQIASDGTHPVWSADGRSIYYMAGADLMKHNLDTQASIRTGLSASETSVGLLLSQPLPDGQLLAQRQSRAPLEAQGGKTSTWGQIGVASYDSLLLSPRGDRMIVYYASNIWKEQRVPSLAVIHYQNGQMTPFLNNCPYAAPLMVWSRSGDQIAYPLHAVRPEVRVYDVQTGQTKVLVRLDTFTHIDGGLSWSPDGKYLAFTVGDGRSKPRSIWLVASDGSARQRLVDGFLPNWSPDGKHILYARPGAGRLLDWSLLEITPAAQAEGAQSK